VLIRENTIFQVEIDLQTQEKGGWGIKDLYKFNISLMCKMVVET
jgi:hypothetical protein